MLRSMSIRWHLTLTYLLIIWLALSVLLLYLSEVLENSLIDGRRAYLYSQAHLIASAVGLRGGPSPESLSRVGGVPSQGRVFLVDSSGLIVADSAMATPSSSDGRTIPEIREALLGRQVSGTYYLQDGTFVMHIAVPAKWQGGGAVFISQSLDDIVSQYRSVMGMVLLGGIVSSLISIVGATGLAGRLFSPLSELSKAASRMASGRLDVRVTPRGPKETRQLSESFNKMAESVERTVRTQEEFLAAAAHELRSPLAAVSALIESMDLKPPDPKELPEMLNDLSGEVRKMRGITEEVLDLLRVGSKGIAAAFCPKDVLRKVISAKYALAREKDVELLVRADDGQCRLNSHLFGLVAGNLIDNAVKYSPEGSSVDVNLSISGEREGDRTLTLSVKDRGVGIPASEVPRIFERFYRIDEARHRNTGGVGLGLAIVKEACDLTGGVIRVESAPGQGSIFEVSWTGV